MSWFAVFELVEKKLGCCKLALWQWTVYQLVLRWLCNNWYWVYDVRFGVE